MKGNRTLRKIIYFIRRNSYALAVSLCVVLALTLISVTAINYINDGSEVVENQGQSNSNNDVPTMADDIIVFKYPIEGGSITKEYADDHLLEDKTTGYWQTHQALDFAAKEGTKVLAVYGGTVEKIEHSMMDGVVITIKHSKSLKTVYKCLGENVSVSEGDKVNAGQEIGCVASNLTEKADGSHLHFELYENNKLIDPTPYFSESGK